MTLRSRSIVIPVALIISLIAVWFLVQPERSYACYCIWPDSPSEELANSAAVFMGRVVSVREFERGDNTNSSLDPTPVEFDVQTVWKGSNYGTMFLTTNRDGSSCGFRFREGETYVVYSHDGSTVNICSRTRRLSDAAPDLTELGERRMPAEGTIAPTPVLSEYWRRLSEAADDTTKEGEGDALAQSTVTPTPVSSQNESGGGCGISPDKPDISAIGLMVGFALLGFRKKPKIRCKKAGYDPHNRMPFNER